MARAHYDSLAKVFAFPGPEFEAQVMQAISLHATTHPYVAASLGEFQKGLPSKELIVLRELHTRTFDVQAITSLDIGYTLFGEDYKRGALLANLSSEHTRAGIDCGEELGDHLTNVLVLLPRLSDAEVQEDLVRELLAPALQEMIREFEPERIKKKEEIYAKHHKTILETAVGSTRVVYRFALEAVLMALRADFGLKSSLPILGESKFAGSVGTELNIEDCGGCSGATGGTR